jgi:ribosomal subunit interface protein
MTTRKELPWNLVTKNLHGHELLRKKIHEKISKLGKHLKHFPYDTVHLHIALERNPKKPLYTAALTLRVPSNILRSEKSSPDLIKALDEAVKALLRELESLKSELRRETFWKRKLRREELHQAKGVGFATEPQAEGTGPQKPVDVVRELLEQHQRRLLRYVRRYLWHEVNAGELPRGAIDARDIVDEVVRRALAAPEKKPARLNWLLWLYVLARQEMLRYLKEWKSQVERAESFEEPQVVSDDMELASGYDPEQPLDIIEMEIEPPVAESKDQTPDARAKSPAEIVARQELLAETRKAANTWPKAEREAFELHFVEGFEPDEIAMLLGQPINRVQELIASLQRRLRTEVLEAASV